MFFGNIFWISWLQKMLVDSLRSAISFPVWWFFVSTKDFDISKDLWFMIQGDIWHPPQQRYPFFSKHSWESKGSYGIMILMYHHWTMITFNPLWDPPSIPSPSGRKWSFCLGPLSWNCPCHGRGVKRSAPWPVGVGWCWVTQLVKVFQNHSKFAPEKLMVERKRILSVWTRTIF